MQAQFRAFLADFRHGARLLRRDAGFAAIAILTLALGIGANTAVFSVVDAVVLRPLAFPRPQELVSIRESSPQFPAMSVSYPDYLDWRAQSHVFSSLAVYRYDGETLTGVGKPVSVMARSVSASYFIALGIPPFLGRTFTPQEDQPGAPGAVVLSYDFWRNRFSSDPKWLGRTIALNDQPYTIVGVMPQSFSDALTGAGDNGAEIKLWTALGHEAGLAGNDFLMIRGNHPGIVGLGRLKPGITLEQARAEMQIIARRLDQEYPKSNTGEGVNLVSLRQRAIGSTEPALWALLAAVGLVLLIACANVANLLLARAAARSKEFAIRSALGASRARLIAQHLGESLVLALLGGAAGLLLAVALMALAPALMPARVPRAAHLSLDYRVLLFTLAVALLTGVAFGLAPALQRRESGLEAELKEGGRGSHAGRAGRRARSALVTAETALSLALLLAAGLLIRSFWRLSSINPGFDPSDLLTFSVSLPPSRYSQHPQISAFFHAALDRLRALPGVQSAAIVQPLPLGGSDWESSFTLPDRPAPPPGKSPSTDVATVSPGYFHAMKIPLLRGRDFTLADDAKAPLVAIIDQTFAAKYWPGRDALGRQIQVDGKTWTVVGVVPKIKLENLRGDSVVDNLVEMYFPEDQQHIPFMTVVLRAAPGLPPAGLLRAAQGAIAAQDADVPISDVHTMDALAQDTLTGQRLSLALTVLFALLALVLAAVGLYGVMSYSVARQTHEIGVRMALGARRGHVLRLVLGEGLRLAGIGLLIGLALALAAGGLLSTFLFGVTARDPATFVAAAILLLMVAAIACYIPARRATAVDPQVALRCD